MDLSKFISAFSTIVLYISDGKIAHLYSFGLHWLTEKTFFPNEDYNDLIFKDYNCGFKKDLSKRIYLKKIINELRSGNKFFNANIINSLEKVNLNNLNGYILDKKDHRNY